MMKTYVATVLVELTCVSPEMLREFITEIPFGDHDLDFHISVIEEGRLPESDIDKPAYRERHGLSPKERNA
jgi:hypothetical protein